MTPAFTSRFIETFGQEREAWHSLVRTAGIGICVTDASRRFVLVNPAYCTIYGYAREELLGQPFSIVLPVGARADAETLHDDFLAGRTEESAGEWTVQRRDGTLLIILATAGRIEAPDGSRYKVTTVQDITESRRAEQAALEAAKASQVAQLSQGMAHDFNNLLGALTLTLEQLAELDAVARETEATALLGDAQRVLARSRALVKRIHELAAPDVPVPRELALGTVVAEVLRVVRQPVVLDDRSNGTARALADPERFADALQNLVVNAVEAVGARSAETPAARAQGDAPEAAERPPVRVVIRHCEREEARSRGLLRSPVGYVCVEVWDDGVGMSPEVRRRIFEPFFTTKARDAARVGRGLGMPGVKRFAEAHGGAVTVVSSPGRGTTVRLYLPAAARAA